MNTKHTSARQILNDIVAPEHPWFDPEKAVDQAIAQLLALLEGEAEYLIFADGKRKEAISVDRLKKLMGNTGDVV